VKLLDHETKLTIAKYLIIGSLCSAFFLQYIFIPYWDNQIVETGYFILQDEYEHGVGNKYIIVWYNNRSARSDILIQLSNLNGSNFFCNITEIDNYTAISFHHYWFPYPKTDDKFVGNRLLDYRLSKDYNWTSTRVSIELWFGYEKERLISKFLF
jgi:hypothetical protein